MRMAIMCVYDEDKMKMKMTSDDGDDDDDEDNDDDDDDEVDDGDYDDNGDGSTVWRRQKDEQLTVEEPYAMLMLASILSW